MCKEIVKNSTLRRLFLNLKKGITMGAKVTYNAAAFLPTRFFSHARLGLSPNIQDHTPNLLEKLGNMGTWPVENLPRVIKDSLKNPKIVTVALTALAMYVDSMFFYPDETTEVVNTAWSLIPKVPYSAGKFALYLLSIETIASYAARAQGRFMNSDLMKQFYQPTEATS